MLVRSIWFSPPLAIGRVGPSSTPQVAYSWSSNDLNPRGSGATTLKPRPTLTIAADGTPSVTTPQAILFRDAEGIRPVAPFFELWADWTDDSGALRSGPLTLVLLSAFGTSADQLEFEIETTNLKAFHYSYLDGDRVSAKLRVSAADHTKKPLKGVSPPDADEPLAPADGRVILGWVQVVRPTAELPGVRLRITPPAGLVYGPTDLAQRLAALEFDLDLVGDRPNEEWRGFSIAPEHLVLNPNSGWARWVAETARLGPLDGDPRNTPGGLLATAVETTTINGQVQTQTRSLGLVDDVSDGVITARLRAGPTELTALARIAIGPPDFAPANRTPVSLADNFKDREDRDSARADDWTYDELRDVVRDIFERANETSHLMHRDGQNGRVQGENRRVFFGLGGAAQIEAEDVERIAWPAPDAVGVRAGVADPLALSHEGGRKHRRYGTLEYLEDRFRENPQLFENWIRRPLDPVAFYDRRMPALMRGSDGRPFHLTRRQWELIRLWISKLQERDGAEPASAIAPDSGRPA